MAPVVLGTEYLVSFKLHVRPLVPNHTVDLAPFPNHPVTLMYDVGQVVGVDLALYHVAVADDLAIPVNEADFIAVVGRLAIRDHHFRQGRLGT